MIKSTENYIKINPSATEQQGKEALRIDKFFNL